MDAYFLQIWKISRAGQVFVELGHGFELRRLVVSTCGATETSWKTHWAGGQESFGNMSVLLEGTRGGIHSLGQGHEAKSVLLKR